jgi:phage tail P2-like protein
VADLLPPNATRLERALAASTARLEDVPVDLAPLIDPAACPAEILPWLAWGESVDIWDTSWSEATKREAIAQSIELHRRKGTRWAVETVLARVDALAQVVEWWEAQPRLPQHTFEIRIPVDAASGDRALASAAERIIRDVVRVKPLREHLVVVQSLRAEIAVGVHAIGRALLLRRDDAHLATDQSQPWEALLQTEDGEPLEADNGEYLDTRP